MPGVEAGVDQWVDGLGDGLLDAEQGRSQLGVVGCVAPVQEAEGVLVVDHELEVPTEAEFDLLAGSLGGGGRRDDPVDHLGREDVE